MTLLRRLFRPRPTPISISWLTGELAIAAAPKDHDWPAIQKAGIRAVLDLRDEVEDNAALVAGMHGLRYLRLPVVEYAAPSDAELRLATQWVIERLNVSEPVLIHCREGRGRSALVACAVLVSLGMPLKDAYQALMKARPQASLSASQENCLQRFANAAVGPEDEAPTSKPTKS
jgi:protein tyrosine phosphatase (PTP) superfamily phosphohydrolase (DUF442 family)